MKRMTMVFIGFLTVLGDYRESIKNHFNRSVPDENTSYNYYEIGSSDTGPDLNFIADNDVRFLLYTRRNPITGQVMMLNSEHLGNTSYRSIDPTRFIIHGWKNDGASEVNRLIRFALLQKGDFNIFTVDWSVGASTSSYLLARNRVDEVGRVLAEFIDSLSKVGGLNFSTLSLIGHSLGGHIAGIAGKRVTRGRIQTIVGLDVAGPLFSLGEPENRLDITDALYVEHIVTNGGILGFMPPIGHANFYPAFGRDQTGCGIDLVGICSHSRAYIYYAESIAGSQRFLAQSCSSFEEISGGFCTPNGDIAVMGGEPGNQDLKGQFWLPVNTNSPFATGSV